MTKEEILDYVMDTPENTNRMVLNDMIDELVNSSGGSTSLIPVTIDQTGQNASISAAEVYEGLQNGLRYEMILLYDDGIICPFGEITLNSHDTYLGTLVASVAKINQGVVGQENYIDIDFINIIQNNGATSWHVFINWARIAINYYD